MRLTNNQKAFLGLVQAGLWEKSVRLSTFGNVDFEEIYSLSAQQAVLGLVVAGLEKVVDVNIPKSFVLIITRDILQIERRNLAMNEFLARLIEKLRKADIYALLIKGQGIAQCYERPLWRSCGDVDLFLNSGNYIKALEFLTPLSSHIGKVDDYKQHVPMSIDGWEVELHGTMRSSLWKGIDKQLDAVQHNVFCGGNVRSWMNGETQVFLPGVGENVVFVFVHILQHFFREGIGLRQICDWCRLLWTHQEYVNRRVLGNRLQKMGLMSEWIAFASLAVNYLGMPAEAMPFYCIGDKWSRKARRIMLAVLEQGNFGHNYDRSGLKDERVFIRKVKTLKFLTRNSIRIMTIFPKESIKSWLYLFYTRMKLTIKDFKFRK